MGRRSGGDGSVYFFQALDHVLEAIALIGVSTAAVRKSAVDSVEMWLGRGDRRACGDVADNLPHDIPASVLNTSCKYVLTDLYSTMIFAINPLQQ